VIVDSEIAGAVIAAIHTGDIEALRRILANIPEVVTGPLDRPLTTRTALHVVCDWPGYFPNGPQIARILITTGANPNYRDATPRSESPLHWAASSDDVDVAAALIDGGADIEIPDGSIGTPRHYQPPPWPSPYQQRLGSYRSHGQPQDVPDGNSLCSTCH
jgi:ankyrin repeat protein